ncbi:MAG TPA: hypothetical protein H9829_11390 [Candidatus Tetragenococcus pullicola]|nr:hypothetical protein [Candidatus Tetragenococcus pullicola]
MQETYQEYLKQNESMTFEEMTKLHMSIIKNVATDDTDFVELWQNLLQDASDYVVIRARWGLLTTEEKLATDLRRTQKHNAIISDFLILERLFKQKGWQSDEWTRILFLENEKIERKLEDVNEHRKRIGDFANYLAFISAINNR